MAAFQNYQRITVPTHWVAFAISLALHALLLWGGLPIPRMLPFDDTKEGRPSGSIAIRIAPAPRPPTPPPAPESRPQPEPSPKPAPKAPVPKAERKPAPKPPSASEILAMERQTSQAPAAARAPAPANDFAAFVEARRRMRETTEAQSRPRPPVQPGGQPTESDQAREERIRAANLGLDRGPSVGSEKQRGGGIFQIARVTSDEAEFFFYGWNNAIQRNSPQMISVRRGSHPTIELAVVRRMMELIRERSSGDFVFESKRLGRDVSLSARAADSAKLEEFLMREFFAVRAGARSPRD